MGNDDIEDVTFNPDDAAATVKTAEDFTNELLGSSAAGSSYSRHFVDTFEFYGKSLEQWSQDLQVVVPSQPELSELQALYIELANNIQIAAHFKAVANAVYNAMSSGMKIQKDDLVTALVNHYLRANITRPAAAVLNSMAESYMKDSTISRESSKIVKEFWNQKYEALVEVRKCLEQLNMSIATEHKYGGGNDA